MATATQPPIARTPTLGDVLAGLDASIPVDRVLVAPRPGTATPADVEAIHLREDRLCELIDGTLVEKTVGQRESQLALLLGHYLLLFVLPRRLGIVLGADGMTRLKPGQVRIPDVAVYLNARFPDGKIPVEAIPEVVPDLAVEVLSPSNTRAEMDRKLREYFEAGVRLVWYADPRKMQVTVYEAVDRATILGLDDVLDGGAVLPGFALNVSDWLR